MAEQKKNVSLWIDPGLVYTLDLLAKQDDRPRNWEIVQAIKAWIDLREAKAKREQEQEA